MRRYLLEIKPLITLVGLLASSFLFAGSEADSLSCPETLQVLATVDGYFSTGGKVVGEGINLGYTGASVLTHAVPKDGLSTFPEASYEIRIPPLGDVNRALEALVRETQLLSQKTGKKVRIAAVMPCTDSAVSWTDFLSAAFGLPGNPVETSLRRCDKGASSLAMLDNKLATAEYLETHDEVAALEWAEDFWKRSDAPIVVRPTRSNGGDGTTICYKISEIKSAVHNVLRNPNQLGKTNDTVLLANYLSGPQYAANVVSFYDKETGIITRIPTGLWHQVRDARSGFPTNVYDHNILLPHDGELQKTLWELNDKALLATEQRVGGSHLEMIKTEHGPVVIDPNHRLAGGKLAVYEGIATGRNTLQLAIRAHAGEKPPVLPPYELKTNFVVVYIRSHGDAKLSHRLHPWLKELKQSGIVHEYEFNYEEGQPLKKSIDSESMVGKVVLTGQKLEPLLDLVTILREKEARREFETPIEPVSSENPVPSENPAPWYQITHP